MFELKKNYPGLIYITENSKSSPDPSIVDLTGESSSANAPDALLKCAIEALACGDLSYDADGYFPLREIISEMIFSGYSYRYNPHTEITISNGFHQAYSTIISALIKEGDEVIVFEPSYYTYLPAIEANAGRPVYVQLKQPDFHINWDEVQKVITARTKLIIINTPHHVSGAILTASDMERLNKIVHGTNIYILSDETYAPVIFEEYEHQSVARYPRLAERSFLISGFSKQLSNDSWQISYCVSPEKLMNNFRKMQHIQLMGANLPFQIALANYLKQNPDLPNMGSTLQKKRDLLLNGLKNGRLTFLPATGSYFQLINYSKLSPLKDVAFCKQLLDDNHINVTPLSYFYHDTVDLRYFRVNFSKPDEQLVRANEILSKLN
ncbi:MAG TPA: aminotransferase class I/II-fold pyridoxal phosphate-dependent enzyme [Bacteroidales bacterium]|nr:aminotransferase class I/II-fold pyridoxal phosphate-dependent enzyme [Bacteroidales bacterium]